MESIFTNMTYTENIDPGDEQTEKTITPEPEKDEPITLAVTNEGIFPVKKLEQ